jgi:hypothetical protein
VAKGYPTRPEAKAVPECKACGSQRFRETPRGLRCEDCLAPAEDPFRQGAG